MIRLYFLLLFFLSAIVVFAQVDSTGQQAPIDSLFQRDSLSDKVAGADTISVPQSATDSIQRADSLARQLQSQSLQKQDQSKQTEPEKPGVTRLVESKDILFYVLLVLLLLFAFLRNAFAKYFSDLFRLFFRTTLKQRQIREQLMQTPLPSLLLNGFFVLTGGLYAVFLLSHFKLIEQADFWLFFLYCGLTLSVIYFVKFIGLKITGWLFNMTEAANSYVFIVFIINKVVGVFLLPILVLLAFLEGTAFTVAMVISWCGVGGLFLYRFILAYSAIHNQVKFNPFHFFLYFCAFEVAPLLLIYKLLIEIFQ